MKALIKSVIASGLLALSGVASATIIQGDALQGVLNDITVDGDSSVNVHTDQMTNDQVWSLTATGGAVATLVIELAGYANINSFGVYDYRDPLNAVELFSGAHGAGDQALLTIKADGSVLVNFQDTGVNFYEDKFGFYLYSGAGEVFFSDSDLNDTNEAGEGDDHMVAYQGKGDKVQLPGYAPGSWTADEYILAWEDTPLDTADKDYTDFVVMVESVEPVPEPAILAMLGLGLAAFGFVSRKRK
ncbi:MAG: DUF4114 domain-containing protein [Gammaproteobacteria bacterium]|nr:MAG: DUF4114 domain-containing protein [Gammaproteobacteria bacterium]